MANRLRNWPAVSIHHLSKQNLCNGSPDLTLEVHMIPVKIEENFVLNNFGSPADIVFFCLRNQANVTLSEVRMFVIGEEDHPPLNIIIKEAFYQSELLFHEIGYIQRKICPIFI